MAALTKRVLEMSRGRDRVVDAVKALALLLVVLGHSLAWTTLPGGTVVNTLEEAPGLYWMTWILQILPLFFFMAGAGLISLGRAGLISLGRAGAAAYYARIGRLAGPSLPLILVTMLLAFIVSQFADSGVTRAAGQLPVQLVWFLGVYLLIIMIAPLIVRFTHLWQFTILFSMVALVDWLRVTMNEGVGWVNLLLVWGFFAAAGVNLKRLRKTPKWLLAAGLLLSVAVAVLLVMYGPYSKALISTTAVPGISNLAPPTLVLLCAGIAQMLLLLLVWEAVASLLKHDWLWVPVAVFSSRAMGVYLYHMLLFSIAISLVLQTGMSPLALSWNWWLLHLGTLIAVGGLVWVLAPGALKASGRLARLLGRVTARYGYLDATTSSRGWALLLAGVAGLNLLLVSESGVSGAFTCRQVLGIPYMPAVSLLILMLVVGVSADRKD